MAELLGEPLAASVEKERREAFISALGRLSDAEIRRLKCFACIKALAFRGMVFDADDADLFHEAIVRTLDGRRNWNPEKIDLTTHLTGVIRSIASQLIDESKHEHERRSRHPLDFPERNEDIRNLYAEQTIEHLRDRLKADKVALGIFDHLREGYTPAEIRELLQMDNGIYDAARKRIARTIKALL